MSGPVVCYTDVNGKPCGEPAVAHLVIVPVGEPDSIPEGRIPVCLRHLLPLMYANGVGPQELADVVHTLSYHMARQIRLDDNPGKQAGNP